ncbi:MAG: hypothetical protein EB111_06405 [Actinobacteria bacterium]|nr:hypothetical protein [Actinomycetota bacterium]
MVVGASGTFDVNGRTETVATISGSGAITLGAGTLTAGGTGDTSYSGVMSGTNGNFTKQGSGTLTLSGNNSHTGALTISAGTIAISEANDLAPATLTLSGGTLSATETLDLATSRPFALASGTSSSISVASGKQLGIAGVISGSDCHQHLHGKFDRVVGNADGRSRGDRRFARHHHDCEQRNVGVQPIRYLHALDGSVRQRRSHAVGHRHAGALGQQHLHRHDSRIRRHPATRRC